MSSVIFEDSQEWVMFILVRRYLRLGPSYPTRPNLQYWQSMIIHLFCLHRISQGYSQFHSILLSSNEYTPQAISPISLTSSISPKGILLTLDSCKVMGRYSIQIFTPSQHKSLIGIAQANLMMFQWQSVDLFLYNSTKYSVYYSELVRILTSLNIIPLASQYRGTLTSPSQTAAVPTHSTGELRWEIPPIYQYSRYYIEMLRQIDFNQPIDNLKVQKYINQRQNQFKKEKASMQQKLEFMEAQLADYKHKNSMNMKLNQSIIMSYKNNDLAREENLTNVLKQMKVKHQQEFINIKNQHARDIRSLQLEISGLKKQVEERNYDIEKLKVEYEGKLNDARIQIKQKAKQQASTLEKDYNKKIAHLESKLKAAESTIKLYKNHIQKTSSEFSKEPSFQYSFIMDEAQRKSNLLRDRSITIINQHSLANSKYSRTDLSKRQEPIRQMKTIALLQSVPVQEKTLTRRQKSSKLLSSVQEKSRASRKTLQYNKQSVAELTSRISRAISSLEPTSRGQQVDKKIQFLKERIDIKLRHF